MDRSEKWFIGYLGCLAAVLVCAWLDIEYSLPFMVPVGVGLFPASMFCIFRAMGEV